MRTRIQNQNIEMKEIIEAHRMRFHANLEEMRSESKLFDFTILVGDKEYQAHKVILAACSDYFRAMFSHDSIEVRENKVHIQEISAPIMGTILDFFYTHKMNLNVDNVQEYLVAASILQVKAVQDLCTNFIYRRIDATNCLGILTLAERYHLTDLHQKAFKYCLNNFEDVVLEKEFPEVACSTLLTILKADELDLNDEKQVFQAIVSWIWTDRKNRMSHSDDLLDCVRFSTIDAVDLIALSSEDLVKESAKCKKMIDEAKNYLLLKDHPDIQSKVIQTEVKPRIGLRYQQRIYALGGWIDEYKSIADAEMYDPKTDAWTEIPPMAQKRCGVGLISLDGSLYAVGGHDGQNYLASVERYDIATSTWHNDVPGMKYVRTSLSVIALDGYIYAIGGQTSKGSNDKVERYDPRAKLWTECAPLNQRRLGAGAAVLDGYIYVMGGSEHRKLFDSVERYDPVADKWTFVAPMSIPRKHLGSASCRGKIYAVGGRNADGELDISECYYPKEDVWETIAPMEMKRCGVGVVEMGNMIYSIGGSYDDTRLDIVEIYNPETGQWARKTAMILRRLGAGVTVHPARNT